MHVSTLTSVLLLFYVPSFSPLHCQTHLQHVASHTHTHSLMILATGAQEKQWVGRSNHGPLHLMEPLKGAGVASESWGGAHEAASNPSSPKPRNSILGHELGERQARAAGALEAPRPRCCFWTMWRCYPAIELDPVSSSSGGLQDESMRFCTGAGA